MSVRKEVKTDILLLIEEATERLRRAKDLHLYGYDWAVEFGGGEDFDKAVDFDGKLEQIISDLAALKFPKYKKNQ